MQNYKKSEPNKYKPNARTLKSLGWTFEGQSWYCFRKQEWIGEWSKTLKDGTTVIFNPLEIDWYTIDGFDIVVNNKDDLKRLK